MEEPSVSQLKIGHRKSYSRKNSRMRRESEEVVVTLNEPFKFRQNFNLISQSHRP